MKDAKGHGSDPRGTHSSRVSAVPSSLKMHVQQEAKGLVRTAAGQRVTTVRAVWKKITQKPKRRAVAEKIALNLRVDDKNARTRFR